MGSHRRSYRWSDRSHRKLGERQRYTPLGNDHIRLANLVVERSLVNRDPCATLAQYAPEQAIYPIVDCQPDERANLVQILGHDGERNRHREIALTTKSRPGAHTGKCLTKVPAAADMRISFRRCGIQA